MPTSMAQSSPPSTALADDRPEVVAERSLRPVALPTGKRRADVAGIALAVICAIHCAATPLIALLPMGSLFTSTAAEWLLPAGAILLGLAVIASDTAKIHRHRAPAALLGVATVLMITGHALDGTRAEIPIVLAGSALLAGALMINVQLRRRARACMAR